MIVNWSISVCVCVLACRITLNCDFSKDGHFWTSKLQSRAHPTEVYYCFIPLLIVSGPWMFQEDWQKVTWAFRRSLKLFESTFG